MPKPIGVFKTDFRSLITRCPGGPADDTQLSPDSLYRVILGAQIFIERIADTLEFLLVVDNYHKPEGIFLFFEDRFGQMLVEAAGDRFFASSRIVGLALGSGRQD